MDQELFEPSLIERNKTARLLYRLSIAFLVCSCLVGVYDLLNAYNLYVIYAQFPEPVAESQRIPILSNAFLTFLYGLLIPTQAYFFYRFAAAHFNKSEKNEDTPVTANAHWLVKQGVTAVLLFGLHALWALVDALWIALQKHH